MPRPRVLDGTSGNDEFLTTNGGVYENMDVPLSLNAEIPTKKFAANSVLYAIEIDSLSEASENPAHG